MYDFSYVANYLVNSFSDTTVTLRSKSRPSEDPLANVPIVFFELTPEEIDLLPSNTVKIGISKSSLGSFVLDGTSTLQIGGSGRQYDINAPGGPGGVNSVSPALITAYIQMG